jgi:hypothetical protein
MKIPKITLKLPSKKTKQEEVIMTRRNVPRKTQEVVRFRYAKAKDPSSIRLDEPRRQASRPKFRVSLGKDLYEKLAYVLLLMIILFAAVSAVTLTSDPIIVIKGQDLTVYAEKAPEIYRQQARLSLANSVLNKTKLTLKKSELEDSMTKNLPEVRGVRVSTDILGRRPVFTLDLKQPMYRLVQGTAELVVTDDGTLLSLDTLRQEVQLITLKDSSSVLAQEGASYLRSDDLVFMRTIEAYVRAGGRAVERFEITNTPRELYVRIVGVPYFVKFYLNDDARTQIGTFFSAETILGKGSEGMPSEYIDVRAGEKVFWR